MSNEPLLEEIAIVGMSGRFPGAADTDAFWENLRAGRESIVELSVEELMRAGISRALLDNPNYVRARGMLDGVDLFDPEFFEILPREAANMDPQHRLVLEHAWAALEHAGCDPERFSGDIGIFAGAAQNSYLLSNLCTDRAFIQDFLAFRGPGQFQTSLGNDKDFLSSRVSYKLNLTGPGVTVQTSCSTSLAAICQACQSLLTYQCDLALAGGVAISFPLVRGYHYQEGGMVSPDGHCRAFDSRAQGTVFGNGLGLVVLRRLGEALSDGDTIYAVIKGAALNNDGAAKVSYTAPSVEGQARVISLAHQIAGITADSISYIEAHGTGTALGDPIELAALTKAFRATTDRSGFCAIGSVKTNIGHLDAAAGVAGLIKTVLALHHRELPPSLHFEQPNPQINFEDSPFRVQQEHRPWEKGEEPRRAGVSSFGVGGTNAHVILEEAPAPLALTQDTRPQILPLSAKTPAALLRMQENLGRFLSKLQNADLSDVAHTLQVGRKQFAHRSVVVTRGGVAAAISCMEDRRDRAVAFLFPGQGAQSAEMGRQLYAQEPVFRNAFDECVQIALKVNGVDLRVFVAGDTALAKWQETRVAQPALFAVSYALAQLWLSWGIVPSALAGHSVGEYVAATLGGVFTLGTAMELVVRRAQLVHALPPGAMLAVRAGEVDLSHWLPEGLTIAAINSPNLCVVAGPGELIANLERDLASRRIASKRLASTHAFHSPMVEPAVEPFRALVAAAHLQAPKIPIVSCVTGRWLEAGQAIDPAYWAGHLREPVRFADLLGTLLEEPDRVLLESGPGQALSTLARQHPAFSARATAVANLPDHEDEAHNLATALGRLWLAGVKIDWSAYRGGLARRKVALPTYPFERRRCWVEPPESVPLPPSPAQGKGIFAPEPQAAATPTVSIISTNGYGDVLVTLCTMLHELSGEQIADDALDATFLDLAFDSLLLTQFRQVLQQRYAVRVTSRQLFEELATPRQLARHLAEATVGTGIAVAREVAANPPPIVSPAEATPSVADGPLPLLQKMLFDLSGVAIDEAALDSTFLDLAFDSLLLTQFRQELQQRFGVRISSRQLFEEFSTPRALATHLAISPAIPHAVTRGLPASRGISSSQTLVPHSAGPFQPLQRQSEEAALTPLQREHLHGVIERLSQLTAKSKAFAQKYRKRLADPRSVAGYRKLWKELTYQTVMERSAGSHVWDVDGQEYIDITMGFGANLLGHSPEYVVQAVQTQIGQGFPIGPQTALAGEAADLICEMTGVERVTFCNTGSEAVMAALRIARAVTGRDKVVYFNGDYHGNFDEVLLRPGVAKALPVAVGIPTALGENVMVLEYGSPAALETLRQHADEIAAVLVEPVQSRHPEVASRQFLQELRALTTAAGSLLIFDEVITGFRAHQGGCQGYFGIKADLATYGKIVGGGFPIGVLAGDASAIDAIDGGFWQFGDDSGPEADMTFFAGTFVRHPLALAAGLGVLRHLKREGPLLQQRLNATTESMLQSNNDWLSAREMPLKLTGFSSLFRFEPSPEFTGFPLLCFHLREAGIYIREPRQNCFLSTAHTSADVDRFSQALREGLQKMREGGWLPESPTRGAGRLPAISQGSAASTAPLTQAQAEVWIACKMHPQTSRAYNEGMWMRLKGALDIEHFRSAWKEVLSRHDALRATFDPHGKEQRFAPSLDLDIPLVDWSGLSAEDREDRYRQQLQVGTAEAFDLEKGPLVRVQIARLGAEDHALFFTAHHLVCDGWSSALLLEEACQIYRGGPALGAAPSFAVYGREQAALRNDPARRSVEQYWVEQFHTIPLPLQLPLDHARAAHRSFAGAREEVLLPGEIVASLRDYAQQNRCTLHTVLFASFNRLLSQLSRQDDLVVGVLVAGQSENGLGGLVGHCANLLPIRTRLGKDAPVSDLLAHTRGALLDAQENATVSFGRLLQLIPVPRQANQVPLISVIFNLDPTIGTLKLPGVKLEIGHAPRTGYQFDLGFNVIVEPAGLRVECDYSSELFTPETIRKWVDLYQLLLLSLIDPAAEAKGLQLPASPLQKSVDLEPPAESGVPTEATKNGRFASAQEELIGGIWAEVLEHTNFGRNEDFFEVGGHSLIAMGMLYRIEQETGVAIPVDELFHNPTVRGLAEQVAAPRQKATDRVDMPQSLHSIRVIQTGNTARGCMAFLTSDTGSGNDSSFKELAERIDPALPFYVLRPRGWDGLAKPHKSKQMMVIDSLAELKAVQPNGPYHLVGEGSGGLLAQEIFHSLPPEDRRLSRVIMLNTHKPGGSSRLTKLAQTITGVFTGPGRSPSIASVDEVREEPTTAAYDKLLEQQASNLVTDRTELILDGKTHARSGTMGWTGKESTGFTIKILRKSEGHWLSADRDQLAEALQTFGLPNLAGLQARQS